MTLKNKQRWIGINFSDIPDLITGKSKIDLPDDAEILNVRYGELFDEVEFLVCSERFVELTRGMHIPRELKKRE